MQKMTIALLLAILGISVSILYVMRQNEGKMILVPALMEEIVFEEQEAQNWSLN